MIYTVTLNPALDKTVEIVDFSIDCVNRVSSLRTDPGGKGINVSKVIRSLGGRSVAVGLLGGETGRTIGAALKSLGLETDFMMVSGETRTNLKVIDPAGHTNTDINEPGFSVSEEILSELLKHLRTRLQKDDIVVLAGSLPKGAPEDTYRRWGAACREAGAKVMLDADGVALRAGLASSPYLIKPNHHELAALIGEMLQTPQDLLRAARRLMEQYAITKAVVSMGGDGALYVTSDAAIYAEGLKVPVKSTVGAGDSVVAALAVAEEDALSPEETVRLLTAVSAANVMCSGTQAAEYNTIRELISQVRLHPIF
jgi:1-phosphofructokinase